jgi:hypothetical protein
MFHQIQSIGCNRLFVVKARMVSGQESFEDRLRSRTVTLEEEKAASILGLREYVGTLLGNQLPSGKLT